MRPTYVIAIRALSGNSRRKRAIVAPVNAGHAGTGWFHVVCETLSTRWLRRVWLSAYATNPTFLGALDDPNIRITGLRPADARQWLLPIRGSRASATQASSGERGCCVKVPITERLGTPLDGVFAWRAAV